MNFSCSKISVKSLTALTVSTSVAACWLMIANGGTVPIGAKESHTPPTAIDMSAESACIVASHHCKAWANSLNAGAYFLRYSVSLQSLTGSVQRLALQMDEQAGSVCRSSGI